MFIYFWEQVWSDEVTSCRWNFETSEIQRKYWDLKVTGYPHDSMEEGVDYVDY